ncbi:unnamed protein product [Rotaria socialis]|uniref:Uncharacterized protein n=1 Tax=Rotaria socialis TaxID=392032 RepID=A0A821CNG5_9BILA|nr:unnamed protein product [Rotaria socialis]
MSVTHELDGFICAFNSDHCCRYCLTHHRDVKNIYKESQTLIRTAASHDLQVKQVQNVHADKSMYGISEISVLSNLPSFHPITSLPPDIMHDILEGIMPKRTSCLLHTIVSTRLCSAVQICQRINTFTYGTNDKRNRPPVFKEKDIFDKRIPGPSTKSKYNAHRNTTYCFIFIHVGKAMEKYCLFINLPFILLDFIGKVPYWFLYELLQQIWDILYSDYPRKSWLSALEQSVQEFLQLFQTIFPEQFIPKFHFLLHAARNTSKYGPLKRQMNLRYEAKHHLLKQIANRCNNFINLPCTVSRRVQLRQCYELMDENTFKSYGISGKFRERRTTSGEEIPLFVEIKYIIRIEKEWRFIVHCYDTVTFKENLWCYEIKPSDVNLVLNKNEFLTHKAEDCYRINNEYFIRVPYRLTLVE